MIEGIDGAGKSTVAPLLFDRLAENFPGSIYMGKQSVEARDPPVREHMRCLRDLIWGRPETKTDLFGPIHWIHLLAAWYVAFDRHIVGPVRRRGGLAVFDGWFFRNVVKTCLRAHLPERHVLRWFEGVPEPDITVLLDVDPELAWRRKVRFKDTEVGRWDGHQTDARSSFISYQGRIRRGLLKMSRKRSWYRCAPAAELDPSEVAHDIAQDCRRGLNSYATGGGGGTVAPRR